MFKKFTGGMSLGIVGLAVVVILALQILTADLGDGLTLLVYGVTTALIVGVLGLIRAGGAQDGRTDSEYQSGPKR